MSFTDKGDWRKRCLYCHNRSLLYKQEKSVQYSFFQDYYPQIPDSAYIDPEAVVIGDVVLGEEVSVWPGVVLRGRSRKD